MGRKKLRYYHQKLVEETQKIAGMKEYDKPIPGDCGVPPSLRTALEYAAFTAAAEEGELRHGQTAFFWHLMAVASNHLVKKEKETKE